jgi:hypothetical protein
MSLTSLFFTHAAEHVCRGGLVATLFLCALSSHAALTAADKGDEEDYNAIAKAEHDPYHVNDLRLTYTMLPAGARVGIVNTANDLDASTYDRETNWDKTGRTGLLWMTPWSGLNEDGDFMLGLEISTNHLLIEKSNNQPEIDFRTYQFTVHPGLGWLLTRHTHLEISPYGSLGYGSYDYDNSPTAIVSGNYIFFELGLRTAYYYTWNNGVQLGGQIAFHFGHLRGETNPSYDIDLEMMGLTLGVQLGYRFK